jgi:anti-sigma regulatory factor (Ser/Thr protein kinase)
MTLASTKRQSDRISKPLTLGAITTSPGTARAAARSLLFEWGLANLMESVELIVSELVTNAIHISAVHEIAPPVQLRMSATGNTVLIEVWDCDPRDPVMRLPMDLDAENGRGLLLVASISARWGWTQFQQGKIVWAEVRQDAS